MNPDKTCALKIASHLAHDASSIMHSDDPHLKMAYELMIDAWRNVMLYQKYKAKVIEGCTDVK